VLEQEGFDERLSKMAGKRTYQRLLTIDALIGSVNWVVFSPDAQTLLAVAKKGSPSGTRQELAQVLKQAFIKRRLQRRLTLARTTME
jgi:hypothetical protein